MKTSTKIILSTVVGVAFLTSIPIFSFVNYANRGNNLEQQIIAQYEQNKNTLSALSLTVMETAQVPSMYKKDLVEVISAGLEGRYGQNGTNAMFVAITEAYPGELSPVLYANIQTAIESGRINFRVEQTKLIDKVAIYRTELGNVWSGFWMRMAGKPTINLDEYRIVTDQHTQNIFESGTDSMIKIGG